MRDVLRRGMGGLPVVASGNRHDCHPPRRLSGRPGGDRDGTQGRRLVRGDDAELAQLCEHLRSIGLRPKLLSRRGIAAALRQWADPTAAERLALWGEESIPPSQAGPATRLVGYDVLRTDGYVHRVGRSPPGPGSTWAPSGCTRCWRAPWPGRCARCPCTSKRSPPKQAWPRSATPGRPAAMAQRKRDEKGIITTEEEERRVDEARSRERELTRGYPPAQDRRAGHGLEPGRRDDRAGLAPGPAQGGGVPPGPARVPRPGP